jgi:hypothetical protein
VSAGEIAAEAAALGFVAEPPRRIPETERYLGSTVAMLRAPLPSQVDAGPPEPRRELLGDA